jgi:serine/threonine protein kinase
MVQPLVQPARTFGRIGRYTLLGTVAEGGMARVFLAQKDDVEEMCVLKQLHVELEEHATASIRFQREAAIASKLRHPNIAKVLDSGFQGSRFYIAMEFIAGQTIDDLCASLRKEKSPMPPSIALAVVAHVLEGLEHAHDSVGEDGGHMRLVHRDLTPRNIMVSYSGDVKIIDFGLARAHVEDDDFRTGPGVLLGTLSYMAPEQALTLDVDARSDLYSVGVILYELLTERPLLPPGSPSETIRRIVREPPATLKSLKPGLPDGLQRVVSKALAKSPDDRYQTAREFREELLGCWEELPGKDELSAFMRGLFSAEERETKWLLEAAEVLRADHRNFFEDTIEDRFDRIVSRGDSSKPDLEPRVDSVKWMDVTDPNEQSHDQLPRQHHVEEHVTDEVPIRIPLDRLDTDTDPGLEHTAATEIISKRPFEAAIRSIGKAGQLTYNLRQLPLDESLNALHEIRFTGAFDLGTHPDLDRVFFRTGAVVGVSPNRKLDAQMLGNALVDLELVTPSALETVPRGLKDLDAELLGRYLIQRGLIDEAGLERARVEQARRRLFHLFERREAQASVREGVDQLSGFFPTMVDIRPIIAFGMVVCSDLERKNSVVQRVRNRRVRLNERYDESRNVYGFPKPIVEAMRRLQEGARLGPMPMLPGLDPMTTAGLLLLLEHSGLLVYEDL